MGAGVVAERNNQELARQPQGNEKKPLEGNFEGRKVSNDWVPSLVFTIIGVALAVLGGALMLAAPLLILPIIGAALLTAGVLMAVVAGSFLVYNICKSADDPEQLPPDRKGSQKLGSQRGSESESSSKEEAKPLTPEEIKAKIPELLKDGHTFAEVRDFCNSVVGMLSDEIAVSDEWAALIEKHDKMQKEEEVKLQAEFAEIQKVGRVTSEKLNALHDQFEENGIAIPAELGALHERANECMAQLKEFNESDTVTVHDGIDVRDNLNFMGITILIKLDLGISFDDKFSKLIEIEIQTIAQEKSEKPLSKESKENLNYLLEYVKPYPQLEARINEMLLADQASSSGSASTHKVDHEDEGQSGDEEEDDVKVGSRTPSPARDDLDDAGPKVKEGDGRSSERHSGSVERDDGSLFGELLQAGAFGGGLIPDHQAGNASGSGPIPDHKVGDEGEGSLEGKKVSPMHRSLVDDAEKHSSEGEISDKEDDQVADDGELDQRDANQSGDAPGNAQQNGQGALPSPKRGDTPPPVQKALSKTPPRSPTSPQVSPIASPRSATSPPSAQASGSAPKTATPQPTDEGQSSSSGALPKKRRDLERTKEPAASRISKDLSGEKCFSVDIDTKCSHKAVEVRDLLKLIQHHWKLLKENQTLKASVGNEGKFFNDAWTKAICFENYSSPMEKNQVNAANKAVLFTIFKMYQEATKAQNLNEYQNANEILAVLNELHDRSLFVQSNFGETLKEINEFKERNSIGPEMDVNAPSVMAFIAKFKEVKEQFDELISSKKKNA